MDYGVTFNIIQILIIMSVKVEIFSKCRIGLFNFEQGICGRHLLRSRCWSIGFGACEVVFTF